MGIAAYNRGSGRISQQIYGEDLRVKPAPVPRPANWGQKTRDKALRKATHYLSYCRSRDRDLTRSDIVEYLFHFEKVCGKQTAQSIAAELLDE